MNEWALNVSEKRRSLGMSQEAFAVAMYFGLSRLRTWEQGRSEPEWRVKRAFEFRFEALKRKLNDLDIGC